MIRCRHGPARALGATYRPVLVEGSGPNDGGFVSAHAEIDVVNGAVGCHCALSLQARGRVIGAEVLDNVVLD